VRADGVSSLIVAAGERRGLIGSVLSLIVAVGERCTACSEGLVHGESVFDSLLSPREGRMGARTIPSYIVEILSTFVGPSVCLFIEKLTHMGFDFDKHGEEAKTHPLVDNLDDAGEYIPVWGMSKEGILALPHPIRGYCYESFEVCENHNGLVVGEGVFQRHEANFIT